MRKNINNYVTNLSSLVELPLRRTACPESIRRVQGPVILFNILNHDSVLYSPLTIDHSRL